VKETIGLLSYLPCSPSDFSFIPVCFSLTQSLSNYDFVVCIYIYIACNEKQKCQPVNALLCKSLSGGFVGVAQSLQVRFPLYISLTVHSSQLQK